MKYEIISVLNFLLPLLPAAPAAAVTNRLILADSLYSSDWFWTNNIPASASWLLRLLQWHYE